jgi:hypothetical protein
MYWEDNDVDLKCAEENNNENLKIELDQEEGTLDKELKAGEEEIAVHKAKVEQIIANQSKEMRIILVKIDKGEDAKMQIGKKMCEIDTIMSQLEITE